MSISLEKKGKAIEGRESLLTEMKRIAWYVLWPFRVIYKIYYLVVFSLLMALSYPFYLYLLAKPQRFPRAFRVMKFHADVLLALTGVIPRVKGIERIPSNGAYIICSNHTSFLDAFCIYSMFPRYFVFTGKKEIEKWPLFHIFYTSGMNITVDRNNAAGAIGTLKRMSGELNRGNPLAIFPEGTRPTDPPKLGPFKQGAFALAIQTQVPIVPVTFMTNWKRLGRGGMLTGHAGPGLSTVVIHPPVYTTGMTKHDVEALTSKVQEIIGGPVMK